MKIELKHNELTVSVKNVARTKAQKNYVNSLAKDGKFNEAVKYLQSFTSKRYMYNTVDRITRPGRDPLEGNKNSMFNMQKKIYDLNRNHVPILETGNWIGVEIECFIPYSSLDLSDDGERECDNCCGDGTISFEDDEGNDCSDECGECGGSGREYASSDAEESAHEAMGELFQRNRISFTSIKGDGSIRADDGCFAVEVVILTRLDRPANLLKVCDLLKQLKAKVNASCGMHIHLDARKLSEAQVKAIGKKFTKVLPVMARLVPKSRRDNDYCRLGVSKVHNRRGNRERYHAVNLTSYRKHRTIEVRLHSSTTDFNKIISWAKFISAVKDAKSIKKVCHSLNEVTDYVYLEQELLEYLTQREVLFNTTPSERQNVIAIGAQDLDSTEEQGAA